jgi:hypothetical protein
VNNFLAQLDYFKFVRRFPDVIAMNGSIECKKELIEYVRKQTYRKEGIHSLLPIDSSMLTHISLNKWNYVIKYKKETIFSLIKIKLLNFNEHFVIRYPRIKPTRCYFLTKEDVQNLKRIAVIDSLL